MKKLTLLVLIMASGIFGSRLFAQKPEGGLIYCSYSCTGAAGLGKDYCELIADVDSVPKVVVVLGYGNRFGDPVVNMTYTVEKESVLELQDILEKNEVYKLDGYSVDEHMTGGRTDRIYMEYSSGEKINAHWYGHDIKNEALSAYALISGFFKPWRNKAENDAITERVTEMEAIYYRLKEAVKKKKAYPKIQEDLEALKEYAESGVWRRDFESYEKINPSVDKNKEFFREGAMYRIIQDDTLEKLVAPKDM